MTLDSEDVLEQASAWKESGRGVAVATVIQTWGSSPRRAGSQLAIDDKGAMIGSVSGGCIESAVVHEAQQVIEDGEPRTLNFGISNEQAWEVGLTCGGKVKVFVERLD
jgi:xanthine/CO dehydrogenase XdhC/CoxF family maturation factor